MTLIEIMHQLKWKRFHEELLFTGQWAQVPKYDEVRMTRDLIQQALQK